jgi:hypothetical protein
MTKLITDTMKRVLQRGIPEFAEKHGIVEALQDGTSYLSAPDEAMGMQYIIQHDIPAAVDSDYDLDLPSGTWRLVSATGYCQASGTTSDSVQIKKESSAISDVIDLSSVAANGVFGPDEMDYSNTSFVGGTDVVRATTLGGADRPALKIFYTFQKIA